MTRNGMLKTASLGVVSLIFVRVVPKCQNEEECLNASVMRPITGVWGLHPLNNLTLSGVESILEPLVAG